MRDKNKSDKHLHDQRTEKDHIETPADDFGIGISSDFSKEVAPLTETSDKVDHRFHRPAQENRPDDSLEKPSVDLTRSRPFSKDT